MEAVHAVISPGAAPVCTGLCCLRACFVCFFSYKPKECIFVEEVEKPLRMKGC